MKVQILFVDKVTFSTNEITKEEIKIHTANVEVLGAIK